MQFLFKIYDKDFNYLNESIDFTSSVLLNDDITLSFERDDKTNEQSVSDFSASCSNLIKLSNQLTIGDTIISYIDTGKKIKVEVKESNEILFAGYLENESFEIDLIEETVSFNVLHLEKEFYERLKYIQMEHISAFNSTSSQITTLREVMNAIFNIGKFDDLLNGFEVQDTENKTISYSITETPIEKLRAGIYWIDKEMSIGDFFKIILQIYNLTFEIDFNDGLGKIKRRQNTNNETAISIGSNLLKEGLSVAYEKKYDYIRLQGTAKIGDSDLYSFNVSVAHAIDTDSFYDKFSDNYIASNRNIFDNEIQLTYETREDIQVINMESDTLRVYSGIELNGVKYRCKEPLITRSGFGETDSNQMLNYIMPVIDIPNVTKRYMLITRERWYDQIGGGGQYSGTRKRVDLYYQEFDGNSETFGMDGVKNHKVEGNYTVSTYTRIPDDLYLENSFFKTFTPLSDDLVWNLDGTKDEAEIKSGKVLDLEKIDLDFYEVNNTSVVSKKDKLNKATREQIRETFQLNSNYILDNFSLYLDLLEGKYKINCSVFGTDLNLNDKIEIKNLPPSIPVNYMIKKIKKNIKSETSEIEGVSV